MEGESEGSKRDSSLRCPTRQGAGRKRRLGSSTRNYEWVLVMRSGEVSQGGRDGSRDEDTRPDDGPGDADADRGTEGCAGAVDTADMGGGVRGERDCTGD